MVALVGSTIPAMLHAHGGLSGEDDPGVGIWWLYGILFGGLGGLLFYRKWRAVKEPPERMAHKRRLKDLERTLKSHLMQLRNADDYPKECGLTDEQRRDSLDSIVKFRHLIEVAKSELLS